MGSKSDRGLSQVGGGTLLGIACADADEAERWAEQGLTYLVTISTDVGMLRSTAQSLLSQVRTRYRG